MARPIAAADSCIISTSPAKPHSKLAGICTVAIAAATSMVTSPSGRSDSSTPIIAWRRRCSRLMLVGPMPGSIVAMSDVRINAPLGEYIGARAIAWKSLRNSGDSRTRMSYSLSPSRSLVGTMPSTMPRSCEATLPTSKPRSAAIARLTRATISGWPLSSVLSMSTVPGTWRILATISSLSRWSASMSSPRT